MGNLVADNRHGAPSHHLLLQNRLARHLLDGCDLTWHFLIWKTPGSLVGTALYVGQDRPETQHATKEAARFMSGPTRAAKCMLKRWCKFYSEAPVLSWSFPYQEMPSEIRAVTDANWAGELEGLRSTSCGWIYFGDHLLVTYSSTQQIVALSTAESENISITKGAVHALEVRSAMVEFGMTCVGWTGSGHETWCRPRASPWMRDCCGCSSCAQKAWLKFEPGMESTTRQTCKQRWTI